MMTAHTYRAAENFSCPPLAIGDLTLFPLRVALGRFLVALCFVLPYVNYHLIDDGYRMEANFLPVLLAAIILPEIFLSDKWSVLLLVPVFAVSLLGSTLDPFMRMAIGVVPFVFVLNLTVYLRKQGKCLLYPNLAYRALQLFVILSVAQTLGLHHFKVIPEWVTQLLSAIVPRYSGEGYDDFGIRGVQGWASEPSSAGLASIAFALVAIRERPDRGWWILTLFLLLVAVNKSIFALLLGVLLVIACLITLQRKSHALLSLIPIALLAVVFITGSVRVSELHETIQESGMSSQYNKEFVRFAQIITPFEQFPHIYRPPILFDTLVEEPLGLLPLVVGYGSVMGLIWLVYILRHNFPTRQIELRPFACVAIFVLFVMASPDQISCIAAVAVFAAPVTRIPIKESSLTSSGTEMDAVSNGKPVSLPREDSGVPDF